MMSGGSLLSLIGGKSTAARLLSLGRRYSASRTKMASGRQKALRACLRSSKRRAKRPNRLIKLATHLRDAKETAAEWQDINTEQKMRDAVAEALEPLKDLKNLVDAETPSLHSVAFKPRRRSP